MTVYPIRVRGEINESRSAQISRRRLDILHRSEAFISPRALTAAELLVSEADSVYSDGTNLNLPLGCDVFEVVDTAGNIESLNVHNADLDWTGSGFVYVLGYRSTDSLVQLTVLGAQALVDERNLNGVIAISVLDGDAVTVADPAADIASAAITMPNRQRTLGFLTIPPSRWSNRPFIGEIPNQGRMP